MVKLLETDRERCIIGSRSPILLFILLIVTVLLAGCSSENITARQDAKGINREISIVFLGDTSFRNKFLETERYSFTSKEFAPLLGDAYYVVGNLEAPITSIKKSPFADRKLYIHAENTTATPLLLKEFSIDAVSLANNHTMDFEFKGLQHTMRYLEENDLEFFGAGDNSIQAEEPLIIDVALEKKVLKIYVFAGFQYVKKYDNDYHFYSAINEGGVANLEDDSILLAIREIKQREPDSIVMIYPHWGTDYRWKTDKQNALSIKFIQAGADLIIGSGSHTIQQIEYINGKPVIYGIGNFLFNSSGRYEKLGADPYSLIARLIISGETDGKYRTSIRLYPILSDNLITGYKTRFVDKAEFDQVFNRALEKSTSLQNVVNEIKGNKDSYGYFIEIPVNNTR